MIEMSNLEIYFAPTHSNPDKHRFRLIQFKQFKVLLTQHSFCLNHIPFTLLKPIYKAFYTVISF